MTELLNKVIARSASLVAGSIIISSSMLAANAGNMYIYKDDSGQVLLTNVNPSDNFNKYSKKVKVNYYPNSGADLTASNTLTIKEPSYFSTLNSRSFSDMPNSVSSSSSIGSGNNLYDHYILESAKRHGVDPGLLKAMMHTESSFNPNARSPVGAQGLMQLMPATARRFSVINAWNPAENIEGAAKYVAWLSRRFNGKIEHVLAGYNAGEGNVDKYGGVPPFRETRNYVQRVLSRYNSLYRTNGSSFNTVAATTSEPSYPAENYAASSTSFGTTSNSYIQNSYTQ
ncbi:lytic transglycosylase domain-containing protein [Psychrobacter phenylpyruvicus]|uniref:Soluble lytic murein transglycosylase n=1 Tax=Psychrobacter phenylpyruvicus TaxID=29432 RepID=A0A379LJP2_9GAMM|nr:lytic transglycosylase domain-containing protein [Psychrobacter phenylpyruvicus]SUD90117.1 Soluble lytic murein transglycosylase precursor [Psychrobacter phenylpyruvicus]